MESASLPSGRSISLTSSTTKVARGLLQEILVCSWVLMTANTPESKARNRDSHGFRDCKTLEKICHFWVHGAMNARW